MLKIFLHTSELCMLKFDYLCIPIFMTYFQKFAVMHLSKTLVPLLTLIFHICKEVKTGIFAKVSYNEIEKFLNPLQTYGWTDSKYREAPL